MRYVLLLLVACEAKDPRVDELTARVERLQAEVGGVRWWCSDACYRSRDICTAGGKQCSHHRMAFCPWNNGACFTTLTRCEAVANVRCWGVE